MPKHLEELRKICLLPCEELNDLEKAIAEYRGNASHRTALAYLRAGEAGPPTTIFGAHLPAQPQGVIWAVPIGTQAVRTLATCFPA